MNNIIKTVLVDELVKDFHKHVIEKLRDNSSNSDIFELLVGAHLAGIYKIGLTLDKEDIIAYFKEVKRRLDDAFDEIKNELKIDE